MVFADPNQFDGAHKRGLGRYDMNCELWFEDRLMSALRPLVTACRQVSLEQKLHPMRLGESVTYALERSFRGPFGFNFCLGSRRWSYWFRGERWGKAPIEGAAFSLRANGRGRIFGRARNDRETRF